jgi:hypothetical protein
MSLNLQYKVGIKRQVVQSLRKVFLSPDFPDPDMANKINVELTYPIVKERYPAIFVSYIDKSVRDSGMGNYYYVSKSDGTTGIARQWFFEGSIRFDILALDPLERDILGAALAGMLAFSKDDQVLGLFRKYVTNEEFVSLQPNFSHLDGGSESVTKPPWDNENEIVYKSSYSMEVLGCFFTDPESAYGGNLVTIEDIRAYPYRADQDIPQGTVDPGQTIVSDWSI